MPEPAASLRPASSADLEAVNALVERAVMTWQLPERVKRLALPSYRYHPHDLAHLELMLATDAAGRILGVAAWEAAAPRDNPAGRQGLLLHGLYVDPTHQGLGVGTALLRAAATAARRQGHDGLLVKAQPDAAGFFAACGLTALTAENPDREYAHRYWLSLDEKAGPNPPRP